MKVSTLLRKNILTLLPELRFIFPAPRILPQADKFILVKGYNGLGNRMFVVINALMYSKLTGRKVYVDWSDGMYAEKGQNCFYDFFLTPAFEKVDWSQLRESEITPSVWCDRLEQSALDLLDGFSTYEQSKIYSSISFDLGKIDYHEGVLVLVDTHLRYNQFKKNIEFYKINDIANTRESLGNILRSNLILNPELRSKIDNFKQQHFGEETIGVHVRHTDNTLDENRFMRKDTMPEKTFSALRTLSQRRPGATIFLSTDNQEIQQSMEEQFSQVVTLKKFYPNNPKEAIHTSEECANKQEMAEHAIMDMYLLAECDYLIYSSKSSFSKFAALVSSSKASRLVDADPKA